MSAHGSVGGGPLAGQAAPTVGGARMSRKRNVRKGGEGGAASRAGGAGDRPQAGAAGLQTFYTRDDGPGIKMSPPAVLIMSLLFIGAVVILHVYGKLSAK
mmetsp:Transcript_48403/g.134632  ORF Transcript_48403/g.134632 Transcript_48403/m.134632 type:complete len:100 (+) Transcript_48403:22-321(+)